MKNYGYIISALVTLSFGSVSMALDLNDGATHIIDDNTTRYTSFRVDAGPDYADAGTNIILMDGGEASDFQMHGNSTITVHGGWIEYNIQAWGGTSATVYGGTIGNALTTGHLSTMNVYGGTIGSFLQASDDGILYLHGTGFAITDLDGITTSLSSGDKLSDFGTYVYDDFMNDYYYGGTISGTLTNNSVLNNSFRIFNTGIFSGIGDIIIIPEPATLSLLTLGAFLAGRRRK